MNDAATTTEVDPAAEKGAAGATGEAGKDTTAAKAAGKSFITGATATDEKKDAAADAGAADKAAADKAAADKAAADKAAQTSAALEVKLPKGLTVDEKQLGAFKTLAKDLKLDGAGAQKFVDMYAGWQKAEADAFAARHEANQKQLLEALESDKELGGKNLPGTQQNVGRARARFFPDGSPFAQLLDETGLGNHPDVVRVFNAIGKSMAEDKVSASGAKASSKSKTAIPYPSMQAKE